MADEKNTETTSDLTDLERALQEAAQPQSVEGSEGSQASTSQAEPSAQADVLEVHPEQRIRVGKNRVLTGQELEEWDRSFTQSRQRDAEAVKKFQSDLEALRQENQAYREYVEALSKQLQRNVATDPYSVGNYQSGVNFLDQGYQSTSASGVQGSNEYLPRSPEENRQLTQQLRNQIKQEVLTAIQAEIRQREERSQAEANLRLQEEALKNKYPGITAEDIYKAEHAKESSDLEALAQIHLKMAKALNNQELTQRQLRQKQALDAYRAGKLGSTSNATNSSTTSNATNSSTTSNDGKKPTAKTVRDRINQAIDAAVRDYNLTKSM